MAHTTQDKIDPLFTKVEMNKGILDKAPQHPIASFFNINFENQTASFSCRFINGINNLMGNNIIISRLPYRNKAGLARPNNLVQERSNPIIKDFSKDLARHITYSDWTKTRYSFRIINLRDKRNNAII